MMLPYVDKSKSGGSKIDPHIETYIETCNKVIGTQERNVVETMADLSPKTPVKSIFDVVTQWDMEPGKHCEKALFKKKQKKTVLTNIAFSKYVCYCYSNTNIFSFCI